MLERCFDESAEATPELELHLNECASCCAKADELMSLESMLCELPFDAPEGIEERIMTSIAQEKAQKYRPILIGLMSTCCVLAVSILNWLFPTQAIQTKAWNYLKAWVPDTDWLGAGRSYREQLALVWEQGQEILGGVEWLSSSVLWGSLIATLVLLMVLNGLCAVQMRQTNH